MSKWVRNGLRDAPKKSYFDVGYQDIELIKLLRPFMQFEKINRW